MKSATKYGVLALTVVGAWVAGKWAYKKVSNKGR